MTASLRLLDGSHAMLNGRRTELPGAGLRLLVLLVLRDRPMSRRAAAAALWPDRPPSRAAGDLRSMLWRLNCAGCDLIESAGTLMLLRTETVIDVRDLIDRARRLVRGRPTLADLQPSRWRNVPELLPGRTDEWLEPHRDHLRLLVLSALRALSQHLTGSGRYADAVEAALAAVALDPLDEDARVALVAAHLGEGNLIEARRAVATYRGMALHELGVEPNQELTALLQTALLGHVQLELRSAAAIAHPAVRRCPKINGAQLPPT
jgi:DNA-binding SARP family transcriptional activator